LLIGTLGSLYYVYMACVIKWKTCVEI